MCPGGVVYAVLVSLLSGLVGANPIRAPSIPDFLASRCVVLFDWGRFFPAPRGPRMVALTRSGGCLKSGWTGYPITSHHVI